MAQYTLHQPSTWAKAKDLLTSLAKSHMHVFRGQAFSSWKLSTSLERLQITGQWVTRKDIEDELYDFFRQRAHHHFQDTSALSLKLDWVAFMQHYGAPTRLLDWTESPYIAAYFAVEDVVDTCAVWAVNLPWCQKCAFESLSAESAISGDQRYPIYFSEPRIFEAIWSNTYPGVYHVEPTYLNRRIAIQQGLFLCPGDVNITFEENLEKYLKWDKSSAGRGRMKDNLHKIELPREFRREALEDLRLMNITRESLYPGIDGFAQSLRYSVVSKYQS